MSEYQRRWLCKECKREWVEPTYHFVNSRPCSITGNPKGDNCPVCGSPEIIEVAFRPYMPGLDIPRDGEYIVLPKAAKVATIPGQTGNLDYKIVADTPELLASQVPTEPTPSIPEPIVTKPIAEETLAERITNQLAAAKKTIEQSRNAAIYDNSDMD